MSVVAQHLALIRAEMSKMRPPSAQTKVYKDECVYSFDSPYSEDGLYLNLSTLQGVGKRYLECDSRRTGCRLYLHQKWTQVPRASADSAAGASAGPDSQPAPTKLAIGMEGGFMAGQEFDTIKEHSLAILADGSIHLVPLPCPELPEYFSNILQACIDHEGMRANLSANSWNADDEVKFVSRYAENLEQVNPTNKRIPQDPKQWKDEASDATDNLWLNLSTGYIGGGRRNWDGSGGSGSALQHYLDTGKRYPLVVKLGTITPRGADVWSYADDESCMVIDPKLAEHLSFWGIDAMKLEKTEKTVTELELDLNLAYDWSRITDGQEKLEVVTGPGLLGFQNIGSSCYLNSAMQCFLAIPEVQARYLSAHGALVESVRGDATQDLVLQVGKLAHGVLSDQYIPPLDALHASKNSSSAVSSTEESGSQPIPPQYTLAPRMFKHLIGQGHAEFSSGRQQDVTEFWTYFLDHLTRAERTQLPRVVAASASAKGGVGEGEGLAAGQPTASLFEFHWEIKYQMCEQPQRVKFAPHGNRTLANMWDLPIPWERAMPLMETEEKEGKGDARLSAGASSSFAVPHDASLQTSPESKRARVHDKDAPDTASTAAAGNPSSDNAEPPTYVPLEMCIETWMRPEQISLRQANGQLCAFLQSTRFHSFPKYLVIKLGRYYVGENWVQRKITVAVPMPEFLDLTALCGKGLQEGEALIEETEATGGAGGRGQSSPSAMDVATEPPIDETMVAQLVSMGFSENGSRRAVHATHSTDVEAAMNWVLEHMEDADFDTPFVLPNAHPEQSGTSVHPSTGGNGGATGKSSREADPEALAMLQSLGYTQEQCTAALLATDHMLDRAADWLFSHADGLDEYVRDVLGAVSGNPAESSHGESSTLPGGEADPGSRSNGKYALQSVISHIGKNTDHGHYVCHIRKQGEWYLFNDDKVGRAHKPPLSYGFVYIYKREDA